MKKKKTYVNNKELLGEIRCYANCGEISDELHMMFYMMCQKIISRPRFLRYTKEWKEDMIHAAYLKCLDVLSRKRFDDDRVNPFSYFTTVISNSFLDSIHLENKQKTISENLKNIMNMTEGNNNERSNLW